jgi:indole-3-glycerol phosphate synthase
MSSRFIERVLGSPVPVIMEIKRKGGQGQDLLRGRSLAEVVADYHGLGAPCLSVVTGRWFGGSDEMLRETASLTTLPILKKDFVTNERQVVEAKLMGASAVLITVGVLPKSVVARLIEASLRHGLTPFVEVANEDELDVVIHGEHCVVAINNKDIRERERGPADVNRSLSLLPSTRRTGSPCPVSASGISDPELAAKLITAGFKGLLIGTGLLTTPSLQSWFSDFEHHRQAGTRPR